MLEYTDPISVHRAMVESLRQALASFSSDGKLLEALRALPSDMQDQLSMCVWEQLDRDVKMRDEFFDQLGTRRNNLYSHAPCPILSSQTRV